MEVLFKDDDACCVTFPLYDGRVKVCEVPKVFSTEVLFWKDEDGTLSELKEIKPKSYLSEQAPGEELSSDIFVPGKAYEVLKAVTFYSAGDSHKFPLFKGRVRISDVLAAFEADAVEVKVTGDKIMLLKDGEFSPSTFRSGLYHLNLLERYHVERCEKEDELTHSYVFSTQGYKKVRGCGTEDAYAVASTPTASLFGVYDGHYGTAASRFCSRHMFKYLTQNESFQGAEYAESLHQVFLQMDRLMRSERGLKEMQNLTLEPPVHDDTILLTEENGLGVHMVWPEDHPTYFVHASPGACAIVVLVLEKKLFIANAGDCRCSLFRNGELTHLTTDHRSRLPKERERILKAGGCVSSRGRVSIEGREREIGELNISRGIGDLHFKMNDKIPQEQQITTAVPDIVEVDISKDCEYLVIYSDGVTREELSSKCKEALKETDKEALEKIFSPNGFCMKEWREKTSGTLAWDVLDDQTLLIVELKQAGLHGADHINIKTYDMVAL